MSEGKSVEFLKQVLGIVEWLNENNGEPRNMSTLSSSKNPILQSMQKELDLALSKVAEKELELKKFQLENCDLLETVEEKEREIRRLREELEKEKWERCHAEMSLGEMTRSMVRLYERIEELIEMVGREGSEAMEEEDDDDVQIVGEKRNIIGGGGSFEKLWKKLGMVRIGVKRKYKKWEEYGEETRKQLERTKQFMDSINETMCELKKATESRKAPVENISPYAVVESKRELGSSSPLMSTSCPVSVNKENMAPPDDSAMADGFSLPASATNFSRGSQPADEENDSSTLTLTFHRSSPPPQPSEYPPHQLDFFHTLLGLPTSTYVAVTSPVSPVTPPLPSPPPQPTSSVIKFASGLSEPSEPKSDQSQPPQTSPERTKKPEVDLGHGVDPSKRHLGFYCLCGLQCSTKKTLQYHLQYLASSNSISLATTPTKSNVVLEPRNENHHRSKKCKRCGKDYIGGKEGLKRHILQEHGSHHNTPLVSVPGAESHLQCDNCPEIFRTLVQLRLHHKVKHSNHLPRTNWGSIEELLS